MRGLFRLLTLVILADLAAHVLGAAHYSPSSVPFDQFTKALAATWSNITSRDPSELIASLTLTMGVQEAARRVIPKTFDELCVPSSLFPASRQIDVAIQLIQLAYDPNGAARAPNMGQMMGFRTVAAEWEASVYRPAHIILQPESNEKMLWVVVRGTSSVMDIFTDITIEPHDFMDGHVHTGILKSALYIKEQVVKVVDKKKQKVWLTGHSLGGGASALAAVMLRNDGYNAHAVAFGPPSCVSEGEWLHKELRRSVSTIVVDSDFVPRLTNESISRLLAPKHQASKVISSMLSGGFSSLLDPKSTQSVLNMFGVGGGGGGCGQHCPPGRLYLMERAKGNDWRVREVQPGEFRDLVLGVNMLTDHSIETYQKAVRQASIRHMKECGSEWGGGGGGEL